MRVTFALFAFLALAAGHTYLSSIVLGGVKLAENDCVRPQWNGDGVSSYRSSPVNDVKVFPNGLLSNNLTCGFLPTAAGAANRVCPVTAGSTIGLQWHHNNANQGDDIIDGSHKGPVMAYMVKADTGTPTTGWFKIYEDGYSNGQWASTDKLKGNGGVFNVVIPSDLAPGKYLLRGEVIALHDGDKPNGVQPYVGCVELQVSGSGNAYPQTYSIPGIYAKNDPGIAFDIYNSFSSYPIPGPRPYVAGTGSTTASATTTSATATTTTTTTTASATSTGTTTTTTTGTTLNGGGSSTISANPCNDPTVCVTVCGQGNVATCSCTNNQPVIECSKSSAAKVAITFTFVLSVLFFAL